MYLWDAKTLHFASMFLLVPSRTPIHYVDRIHFTPDGEEFFFRNGGLVCRCQFRSEGPEIFAEGVVPDPSTYLSVEHFQIAPQGDLIAFSNSQTYAIDLYKLTSLQYLTSFPTEESPDYLTFSPDGHYLASVDDKSRVCIWNTTTGQLEETFISHPGPLMEQMSAASSLAWSARGDILAVGGSLYEINDYSIKLWKVEYL